MKLTQPWLVALLCLPAASFAAGPLQPGDQNFIPMDLVSAGPAGGSAAGISQGAAATSTAAAASVATTGSPSVAKSGDDEHKEEGGLHVSSGISTSVGLGTFVAPATSAYLSSVFNLGASYGFEAKGKKLVANLGWIAYYELTLPDDASVRRFSPWDLRPGLSAPALWTEKNTGIVLSPGVGLTIPSSIESVHAGLITSLSASLAATKKLGPFSLRLSVNGARSFYTQACNCTKASTQTDPWGHAIYIGREGETVVNTAGMNPAWSLITGAGVNWSPTKAISVSVGYTYANTWKYAAADTVDEYTPKALDSNGNPVAHAGMGRGDRVIGTIAVSYAINDFFSIDASMFTAQAPLIKDKTTGQYVPRFPYLAFGELAGNASSVSFGLSGNF